MPSDEKGEKPVWLDELQKKSWEPEILLSGIVLYGMIKAPELLDYLYEYVILNFDISSGDFNNFINLFKVGIYWLTLGLILHLISRGIWVGMVGLSYTYPKGINMDRLSLSGKFKSKIERIPSLEQIIINLEKISSMLFSISFMMFMMIVGTYSYLFIALVIPIVSITRLEVFDWDASSSMIIAIWAITALVIGLIGLLDFLTLGYLKRFKWIAKLYYPIYKVLSTLTLARYYRPIYYTLISNTKKWKIALFMIPFVLISFNWIEKGSSDRYPGENLSTISMWSNQLGSGFYTGYYDDQNGEITSVQAHIQSDIIRGNTVKLFIPLMASKEDTIKKYGKYDSLRSVESYSSSQAMLEAYKNYYEVLLDDTLYPELRFFFHYKSKLNQRGVLTFLDVSDVDPGIHELTVRESKKPRGRVFARIPFYRELSIPQFEVLETDDDTKEENYLKLKPILPK